MLSQTSTTIASEMRDFPEWHHGRKNYAVWVLRCDGNNRIQKRFEEAREHLDKYLLEPYRRQPHITLFVCGFLVAAQQYNDDVTQPQLDAQIQSIRKTNTDPFEIEIGKLNSFASAPFLEIHDPDGGIPHLRKVLSQGAPEFRTASYRAHLTVGLYASEFPRKEVAERIAAFSKEPIRWTVEEITLATYKANEYAGRLAYPTSLNLRGNHKPKE